MNPSLIPTCRRGPPQGETGWVRRGRRNPWLSSDILNIYRSWEMDGIVLRLSQGGEPVSLTEIKCEVWGQCRGGEGCLLPDWADHVLYLINHIFVVRNRDNRLGNDKITHYNIFRFHCDYTLSRVTSVFGRLEFEIFEILRKIFEKVSSVPIDRR